MIATRSLLSIIGLTAFLAATADADGAAQQLQPASASVTLSSAAAGARPVTLTLTMRYDMQCARPGPGPLVIIFPASEQLPSRMATGDVLVNGHPAPTVQVSGREAIVGLPVRRGPLCDVIAPAALKIVFTRGAGVGNPRQPGTYPVVARTPRVSAHTTITVK